MARLRSRFHIWLLLVTVVVLVSMAAAPARQVWTVDRQVEREEHRLEALRKENARLEAKLERLDDPDHLEKLAREQLGLVRPGETAYVVVPPPPPTSTSEAESEDPWYRKIWDWFAGKVD